MKDSSIFGLLTADFFGGGFVFRYVFFILVFFPVAFFFDVGFLGVIFFRMNYLPITISVAEL